MVKRILTVLLLFPTLVCAQINTERVMTIARNALYFEDYVLSIQYFNQVINAKPYLYEPYFFRALAKVNLEDYQGAEADCNEAIKRNPFVVGAYQVRGLARIRQNKFDGAIEDYQKALHYDPEKGLRCGKGGFGKLAEGFSAIYTCLSDEGRGLFAAEGYGCGIEGL